MNKASWPMKSLGEVLQKTETVNPHQSPEVEFEYIDVSSVSNVTFQIESTQRIKGKDAPSRARKLVRMNDVLFATIRPTLQRIAVVPEHLDKQVCSTAYSVLRPKPEIDHIFLFYWLFSEYFITQMECLQKGASYPAVTDGEVKALVIPVPPLPDQRRIVAILDEAFAGIATAKANAEKNLQNARALFESHLQSVFTERGEGWIKKPLGEIGKVCMCKRILKEQTTSKGDIPFYKIGTFGKEADAFIPIEIYSEFRKKYSFPNKGDVLISAAGTIGRRVVYDGEDAYFQDSNIVWIANDQTQILNHYLYHFFGACEWNSTRGATISRLYNDNLRQIVAVFPKSHHEQRRIAAQLDDLIQETQRLESLYQQKLMVVDELKKSLLHQAFSGAL
jgi:type I restriction enzyme S subunit